MELSFSLSYQVQETQPFAWRTQLP